MADAGKDRNGRGEQVARSLRACHGMVVVLLVLFPILLMVATPLAWVDIALAIALIGASRLRAPRRPAPHPVNYDANV